MRLLCRQRSDVDADIFRSTPQKGEKQTYAGGATCQWQGKQLGAGGLATSCRDVIFSLLQLVLSVTTRLISRQISPQWMW